MYAYKRRLLYAVTAAMLMAATCAGAVRAGVSPALTAPSARHLAWRVLGPTATTPNLSEPQGLAVDGRGNVFVADDGHNQIQKLSSTGRTVSAFGSFGRQPGQFNGPTGVAIDHQGNVYVTDTYNNRIQKLSPSGIPLAQWGGTSGGQPGHFRWPWALALDARGNIYVADTANWRVQKLSPSGKPLAVWSGFNNPNAIGLDTSGNVYVSEGSNCSVKKVSPAGRILAKWSLPACTMDAHGLAVDRAGNIYVAMTGRIVKFSPTGRIVAELAGSGTGTDPLAGPTGVAVDQAGSLYVTEEREGAPGLVHKLSPEGRSLAVWGVRGRPAGSFRTPVALTVDGQGEVFVADMGNFRVQVLGPDGRFIREWGGQGRFVRPVGIAFTADGNVLVTDNRDRIYGFSTHGQPVRTWRLATSGFVGMAASSHGGVFAMDGNHNRVIELSAQGRVLRSFAQPATQPHELIFPVAVAADTQGNLYMATSSRILHNGQVSLDVSQWRHQIVKFAPNGKMLWVVSRPSQGSPAFYVPQGLAVDQAGNIYETDTFRSQIVELSASGQQLGVWGGGTDVGQFSSPRGLAIDARGNVYVADTGNERIQELPATPG